MALHTDLPIYRTGVQLLSLAFKVQEQMPRGVKRSLGEKISQHCVEMLDLMALANATQRHARWPQRCSALKPCQRLTHTPLETATWAWCAKPPTATKSVRPCAGR
jgi:hypothetical protein